MSDHNPTMFCHDGTTIYYPTGPGRVHMITIAALADYDGSDSDFEDSTARGNVGDLPGPTRLWSFGVTPAEEHVPLTWPEVHVERNGDIAEEVDYAATVNDFAECIEMWADWCDRDSARLDVLDELEAITHASGFVEAVSCSQPAVAI